MVDKTEQKKSQGEKNSELDTAGRSLSDALRISFFILKLIMAALIIFVLISGFQTIGSDEAGIVLRFGKIRGEGENRILTSRSWPYWIYPYPVEQLVKIPVEKNVTLHIDSFWYFQTEQEKLSKERRAKMPNQPLQPVMDGYNLVRGEERSSRFSKEGEGDYNIVHTKWTLEYHISNPEKFFKNVLVEDVKSGQIYFDVMKDSVKPMLTDIVESSAVTALVHYSIDEVKYEKISTVTSAIKSLIQQKLDKIESGIKVISLNFDESTWPLQVDSAFQAYLSASLMKKEQITKAQTDAQKRLNESGGVVTERLLAAIKDANTPGEELEGLWAQLAGKSQDILAQATAYRTTVVKNAESSANYLEQILPEYRKRPELIIHDVYMTAMEQILQRADEKIILQPVKSDKGNEVRVFINRNPNIKREKGAEKAKD
jgi:regulator of protease activity HflC (stomatin/prohibitin superfamily)